MKYISLLLICLYIAAPLPAQKQTYDLLSYTVPKGWQREEKENQVLFTRINNLKKTWCQIALIKSTVSKGSLQADFDSEWKTFIADFYGVSQAPRLLEERSKNGWKIRSATGSFRFNDADAQAVLLTMSGYDRCISVVVSTNNKEDLQFAQAFMKSTEPIVPAGAGRTTPPPAPVTKPAKSGGFQYTSTNFDDGWTSMVMEDWVEVKKNNIIVRLHYPREEDKKYYSQQDEHTRVFWNLLVAPRYSNLQNFELLTYNMMFEPGRFAAGNLVENASGKSVYVVLFSKAKSGWIEVMTPDRNTFIQAFGIQNPDTHFDNWDPLQRLSGYNKFAVGENDLLGKWSSNFSSVSSLYNIYTGVYMGAATYGSSSSFHFLPGKRYQWRIAAGTGGPGGIRVDKAESAGTYRNLGLWQIHFSDIERKARTYNAYYSCIKGGRILWLQDTGYGGYTAYGKTDK